MTPGNLIRPLLTAVMDSMSRWSVGSSSISTLEPSIIMREKSTRTFSPPESTRIFFHTVLSGKEHAPEETADIGGVLDLRELWSASSTMVSSVSKIAGVIFREVGLGGGNAPFVTSVVRFHFSGEDLKELRSLPARFRPTNATLSSRSKVKEILSRISSPSMVLERSADRRALRFRSRGSGRKSMYGYFRLDGLISSSSIFSSAFFREVACLDLEAFAEKREMKSCSSLIFSSFFLLASFICLIRSWLDSYQKS